MKRIYKYLYATDFFAFCQKALRNLSNINIAHQVYIELMCFYLAKVAEGSITRFILNAPPRHLKTLIGAVCLAAYELARDPTKVILVVCCNQPLANTIVDLIREILRSNWFQEAFPHTCIKPDHSRSGDFETTRGGGVRGISIDSHNAGLGANLVIGDDLLDVSEWNNYSAIEKAVQNFQGMIMSRFNKSNEARAVFIAHRLNDEDPTAFLMKTGEWDQLALAFQAVKTETFDLGYRMITREKGTILRPDSYTEKAIANLPQVQVTPPYELYYQQGVSAIPPIIIKRDHFKTYSGGLPANVHYIMSVDPAQKAGARSSYNVIQVWATDYHTHWLCDQWREQCGYDELVSAFIKLRNRFRPSAILIEDTANGTALISRARRKASWRVVPIVPDSRSKSQRLSEQLSTIASGRIFLPEEAKWRNDYVEEFVSWPRLGTDRVDATTQFLDYISTEPALHAPPTGSATLVRGSHQRRRSADLYRRGAGPSFPTGNRDTSSVRRVMPGERLDDGYIIVFGGDDSLYRLK
jgi:predicted phage terminase large subunit-like protein